MKLLLPFILLAANFASAQNTATVATADLSPAQRGVVEAQRLINEKPAQVNGYNLLASALIRRARETSDPSYYGQAEEAVQKSLKLSPDNFDTKQIEVSVLLGKHEFPAALEAAKALNKQVPDAVMVYGMLTDANVALGNYKDAETSAQWMLNLRPGNLPALVHAAQLRELFGDGEGSNELLEMALQSTPPSESDERASLLTQMGSLRMAEGKASAAEQFLQQALVTFPDYPDAVDAMGKLRMMQRRYDDAAVLFQQRYKSLPRAQYLFELAEAFLLAGHKDEADKTFAEFETKAAAEANTKNNANRELIFYYADYAQQPGKALTLAKQEYSWRQDVYTLDAYAWALHVNGQDAEARKQIESALAVGIRDAQLFRHAGEIVLKAGDLAAAQKYFQEAVSLHAIGSEHAQLILSQEGSQLQNKNIATH